MNTKYLLVTTVTVLGALYLGCVNNNTAVDPRVPAGNAVSATSSPTTKTFSKNDATGYWLLARVNDPEDFATHLAIRQLSDGTLIGHIPSSFIFDGPIKNGKNTNGQLKFDVGGKTWEGAISEDGTTVSFNVDTYQFTCTRLF